MTTEMKYHESSSEDIDLFRLIERGILFFRRYRWIFIIAIILGLGAGFYLYRSIPKTYKSDLLVHSYFLTNQEEIQIVKTWNQLLTKKEYAALASIFNCDQNMLHKVKKIKASELQQVFTPTNPHGFVVEVLVTDNEVLDELQAGIVYGFENTAYIKQRLAVKKEGQEELINKTDAEIKKLDSTKQMLVEILEGKGRVSSSLIIDGSSVNRLIIEMNEKLINMKESLRFTTAVQVLQDFAAYRKPVGPKLLPLLFIGLVVFLGIAYIISLFLSISGGLRVRALQRKKSNESTG